MMQTIFGGYGLERETLRVDSCGRLAKSLHPFTDPHIQRDFCEYQMELITPVCKSLDDMMAQLAQLDQKTRSVLQEQGEQIWLYSNPPYVASDTEIRLAQYHDKDEGKYTYRKQLESRYGRRKMLYSGIHFNLSFSDDYLAKEQQSQPSITLSDLQNQLYFRLFKQISRYSWFLLLLTAASPIYDASLEGAVRSKTCFTGDASRRSGKHGYWNLFLPILDFTNRSTYVKSIQEYIRTGELFSASELYLPVRLKSKGENSLDALEKNGVDHIELRMFDLNPLEPLGIAQKDLEFSCLFLEYLLSLEDFEFTPEMQAASIANHQATSQYDWKTVFIDGKPLETAVATLFEAIQHYFKANEAAQSLIQYEAEKLQHMRPCQAVFAQFDDNYAASVLRLSAR